MTENKGLNSQRLKSQSIFGPMYGSQVRISPYKVLEGLSSLRIDIDSIKLHPSGAKAGGGNADVVAGVLEPRPLRTNPVRDIAIKKLRLEDAEDPIRVLAFLAHEVSLLTDLEHENIVKLIGFAESVDHLIAWMIFPWEENGNLRDFIGSADWEFPERLSLIYDVINGVAYIHGLEPPIVHGDLKSLNVLVNSERKAVLTDFGSARRIQGSGDGDKSGNGELKIDPEAQPRLELQTSGATMTLTCAQWTLRWAAPELLENDLSGLPSDVWAFGWICWEVLTGILPFETETDVSAVLRIIEGHLPTIHGDARIDHVVALASVMSDCWNLDPEKRPKAKVCKDEISHMERVAPRLRGVGRDNEGTDARLHISLANGHARNANWDQALEHLNHSIRISNFTQDSMAYADTCNTMGQVYTMKGDLSSAERSYQSAFDSFTRLDHSIGIASAHYGLAEVYRVRQMASEAEEHYVAARNIYNDNGQSTGAANAHWALGQLYSLQKKFEEAEKELICAWRIYEKDSNNRGLAHVAKHLGDLHELRGGGTNVPNLYNLSRDIFVRLGDKPGLVNTLHSIGMRFLRRKEFAKSTEALEEAQQLSIESGVEGLLANTLSYRGWLCRYQQLYDDAERFALESGALYQKLGVESSAAECAAFVEEVRQLKKEAQR